MFLRSLTIHQYEQFQDCPRIEFSPDENVILGVNGAGKTQLLRLFAAVLRFQYGELARDPFHIEFEIVLVEEEVGELVVQGEVKNVLEQEPQRMRAGSVFPSRGDGLRAELLLRCGAEPVITARVQDRQLEVSLGERRLDAVGLDFDRDLIAAIRKVHFLAEGRTTAYRSLLELSRFARATPGIRETDTDFVAMSRQIEHRFEFSTPGEAFLFSEPEQGAWQPLINAVFLATVKQARAQEQPDVLRALKEPIVWARGGVLRQDPTDLLDALGAESMSFRLNIDVEKRKGEMVTGEGKGIELRVRFRSGTEVIDHLLTFGQKRLITIALAAIFNEGAPMIIDEIDNGLHPRLLEQLLNMISGRQVFVTSHNKLVIDLLEYPSAEALGRMIHICRRSEDGSQSLVSLSDAQARELFEDIENRLMSPSDVLRGEGLW